MQEKPKRARTGPCPAGDVRPHWRRSAHLAGFVLLALLLAGCNWFSSGSSSGSSAQAKPSTVSVFSLKPGACFNPPADVKAELSDLTAIPCSTPHTQEFYTTVKYQAPQGVDDSVYPGDAALASYANGSCAQQFGAYVGVSYLDSSLYFTYLLPSARSWQSDDRDVACFVTTTGKPLTASVKGSKL